MKRIRVGDEVFEVDLQATSDGLRATVGEESLALEIDATGPGGFVLRQGDSVHRFHCVRDAEAIHLWWGGRSYRLVEEQGRAGPPRPALGGLEAPMPGKVISLSVSVGQPVSRGDEILVVEAMKMENAVRAPRDGIVRSVAVEVGDSVNPGVVLVELDDPPGEPS